MKFYNLNNFVKNLILIIAVLFLPSITFGGESENGKLCNATSMTAFNAANDLRETPKRDIKSAISIYNQKLNQLTANEGQNRLLQLLNEALEPYIKYGLCQSLKNPSMSTESIKLNARRICFNTLDSGSEKMNDSEINCLFK